jgi:sigma-B regulation protein RsbU (phosphoserine phosphatase)
MINTIIKFWIRNRIKFIIATAVLLALISTANFVFIYNITAQSNDECLWTQKVFSKDSVIIVFEQVKVDGVTWQAGIRNGDLLIAIDGKKTTNNIVATQILDKVQKGDYATYTVKRGNSVFDTPVLVKKLINIGGFAFNLLASLWLLVGFIVIMAKPEGRSQRVFFKIGVALVLNASNSFLFRGFVVDNPLYINPVFPIIIDNISNFAGLFLPFLLFNFFSVFPKDFYYVTKKWFQRRIYLIPLFLSVIHLLCKIYFVYILNDGRVFVLLNNIVGMFNGIGFLSGFVLLVIGYLKLKTRQERIPIFIILIAYFVGILALIYTNFLAPSIAGIIFNNPAYFTPIILIALLPISFGFSIFKYSLMDVSDVIKNSIIYITATAMLAGIYFLIIYLLGQSIGAALSSEYQGIVAGIIFVVFAVVFQSTKDRFQELLTKKFYPEQFSFQKNLLKFSNDVAVIVGMDNILESTEQLFVNSLKLRCFGIMMNNNGAEKVYQIVRQQGFYDSSLKIYDDNAAIEKYFLEGLHLGKKTIVERQDFKHIAEGRFSALLDEEIYTIVPLIIKSKVIGLLLFGLKFSGSQFTAKDMELLISAASQTAVSIENARLYESELEKHKLERDLENARLIQESLLPKVSPEISGLDIYGVMLPAMHVGGDYYDIIKVSEKKVYLIIGDVSGKGLSASLYMSKLQTMVKLYCTEGKSPKDILIEINKRIYSEIEKNWFITVTVALVDLEKNILTFARAGHTPLIRINYNLFEVYQTGGVGVGIDKGELFNSSLEEMSVIINSGDLFFLFSDGITELMNREEELFGFERLKNFLKKNIFSTSNQLGKNLVNELDLFRSNNNQYDDITFIALKVK